MKMKEHTTLWWAGTVTTVGTALVTAGVVISFVWGVAASVATVEMHEQDIEKLKVEVNTKMMAQQSSVETIESSVLVPRIRRQMERRCVTGRLDEDLLEMVNRWRSRYKEIEDREFPWGRCEGDEWVPR